MNEINPETLRWKIEKDLELYRFYLEISVKAEVFLLGISGAIASYVLSGDLSRLPGADGRVVGIALALPALMNAGFAVLFFCSMGPSNHLSEQHEQSCKALGISKYNMGPLWAVCTIFAVMCCITAAGLFVFLLYVNSWWPF